MSEELNRQALPGGESAQTPTPDSQQEPAPAEQAPVQYLTRDEALTLARQAAQEIVDRQRQDYEEVARTQGERAAQSLIDKRRFNERVKAVEGAFHRLVQTGQLDQSQASELLQQARMDNLADLLLTDEEPATDRGGAPPPDPMDQWAMELVRNSGLTQQDPEWAMILDHENPFVWHDALKEATATKAARLARAQAAQNAQTPAAQQPPAQNPASGGQRPAPVPTGAQAVGIDATGGTAVTDLATLRKQFLAAARAGDQASMDRLQKQIEVITLGKAA